MNPLLFYEAGKAEVTSLADGLIAYYKLDGNAVDVINGFNGTNGGTGASITTYSSGIIGSAKFFQGDANGRNFITIADADAFSFTDGTNDIAFSISFWAKPSQAISGAWLIQKRDGNTTLNEWQVVYNSGQFSISLRRGSASINAAVTANFDVGVLKMITVTYNGSKLNSGLEIYLDGVLQTTTKSGTYTGMLNTTSTVVIGNGFSGFYNGIIDEVAIYKGIVLSQDKVTKLYNSGFGKQYPY